jgi:hypothetical protein
MVQATCSHCVLPPMRKPVDRDNQDECRIASSRNAPERIGHCLIRMLPVARQFVNRGPGLRRINRLPVLIERPTRRDPNRLSCSTASLLSRPDLATPKPRRAAEGIGRSRATHSHAQGARAREHGEDGEHRTFPEASTVALSRRIEDRVPLRTVTSRNRGHTNRLGRAERCLHWYVFSSFRPKHHFMRQPIPPCLHPAL